MGGMDVYTHFDDCIWDGYLPACERASELGTLDVTRCARMSGTFQGSSKLRVNGGE